MTLHSEYGFVAGTLVWAEHGQLPIESLKAGDRILPLTDADAEHSHCEVRRVVMQGDKTIVAVRYTDPSDGGMRTTYASAAQPLLTESHGWVAAGLLRAGQHLVDTSGQTLDIQLVAPVYATDDPGIGWHALTPSIDPIGLLVDFNDASWSIISSDLFMSDIIDNVDQMLLVDVYALEIDSDNVYFVGSTGIQSHGRSAFVAPPGSRT